MATPGAVNRAELEENYQNPGDVYDDTKTEGALNVLADQIDANAVIFSVNGAQYVTIGPITGVTGSNVYAALQWMEQQIQTIQAGAVPAGSITNGMLQDGVVSYVKLDTSLKGSIDTANKFRVNNGVAEYNDGSSWKAVGGVKSVQRGLASVSGTTNVTITAVDLNKTFVVISSHGFDNAFASTSRVTARLTTSTNLELKTGATNASASVAWEVVESY